MSSRRFLKRFQAAVNAMQEEIDEKEVDESQQTTSSA
jgi:hypothetical protein